MWSTFHNLCGIIGGTLGLLGLGLFMIGLLRLPWVFLIVVIIGTIVMCLLLIEAR